MDNLAVLLDRVAESVRLGYGARAALRFCGVDGDLILVSVGPIAFVVILASTLHLVSVFRLRYGAGAGQREAAHAARREKFATAMLAALTTAVGFGVFLLSDLRSVSQLGLTVAITVLVVVPLAFLGESSLETIANTLLQSARLARNLGLSDTFSGTAMGVIGRYSVDWGAMVEVLGAEC